MHVDFPQLCVGLALLWFPRQWLRRGKVIGHHRRKKPSGGEEPWKTREPGDPRLSYREFAKPRNYLDLLRGAAGAVAIVGGFAIQGAIRTGDSLGRQDGRYVMMVQLGILLVGVIIQMIRFERQRLSFYAPVFFLAGLSVALCGPWAALFAFILVWAICPLFGNGEAFLVSYAAVLVAYGLFFHEAQRLYPIAAGLFCFLPALMSMLLRRPLVVFTRKAPSGAG